MKSKVLGLLAGMATVCSVHAQTHEVKRDTVVLESTDRYKVETNRFFDNWFIGAGAGAQIYFGDHNRQLKFGDRITPAYNVYLGKAFTPGIAVRAGLSGFKIKGATQSGSHSTGVGVEGKSGEGYWLTHQEFNYYHLHADALFNLTNIFGGYKEDRFYNISPYAGLGWMWTEDEPKEREVSANIGIFNAFRLGRSVDLTLDVRGAMVNDRFDGEDGKRRNEGPLSATLGLVYKFKQRNWEKPKTTVIKYDEAELQALRDRVRQLASDNDALRRQLANAADTSITNIQVEKKILAAPILVTFPINKSIVSNEARVNLGFFAKVIKEAGPDIVYSITGYADKGTGTPAINEKLSRDRAQAIYNVLVKEFGVAPAQLKTAHQGGVANMFYDDPRLSRAVIVIGD